MTTEPTQRLSGTEIMGWTIAVTVACLLCGLVEFLNSTVEPGHFEETGGSLLAQALGLILLVVGALLAVMSLRRNRGVKRWISMACFVLVFAPTLVELVRVIRAVVFALH
jgi:predicted permease